MECHKPVTLTVVPLGIVCGSLSHFLQWRQVKWNNEHRERTVSFKDAIRLVFEHIEYLCIGWHALNMQRIQKGQGQEESSKLTSIFEDFSRVWDGPVLSLVDLLTGRVRQLLGTQSCGSRACWLWYELLSALQQVLDLLMLWFPQLQSREILPMIILPRSNVVIKMAVNAFCKFKKRTKKKKKQKTPTEEACCLYVVFARISEEAVWSKTV